MLHVGDTTTIEITVYDESGNKVNLIDVSECYLYIKRGQNILKRVCSVKSPPENGVITYQLISDDLTVENIDYTFQPTITFNNGDHFNGTAFSEQVYPTLEQSFGE